MNKTIAVIFGGKSVEHDVSIITAHSPIIDTLLTMPEYNVVPIYISKAGGWYSDVSMNNIDFFRHGLEERISKLKKIVLSFSDGFEVIKPSFLGSQKTKIDLVFPAMHGTYGEDGSLMGVLRMAGVPFVGCDIFASAVAMDKVLTKQVLKAEGVKVVKDVWFTKSDFEKNRSEFLGRIKLMKSPLFIKPAHLGSSIGISKVNSHNENDLLNAIEVALHYDDKILVEEAVPNLIEVTLPIMGNEDPLPAFIERPLNKSEFFDYQEKYMNNGKKNQSGVNRQYSDLPAKLEKDLYERVQNIGIFSYKVLGCEGISRIDFLIDSITQDIFVNEVNTLPGSLYQHNWKKFGISNVELINILIKYAESRFERQKENKIIFSSEILTQYKGGKVN
jgi:D-alanine-D-alanine ligase